MRWKFLMPLALVLGLLIALVDSSPNRDDTGITAAAVFGSCGILGALHPRRAWQWALAIGLWIPALGIALHQNYESWVALAVALVGAYAGKADEVRSCCQSLRCWIVAGSEIMVTG
jgi:hypothetical protein